MARRDSSRTGSSRTPVLTTDRLVLRAFGDGDREPFARMNADPVVMEHFVEPMTTAASDAFLERIRAQWQACGWGLWALERRDSGELVGFAGLSPVRFDAPFGPAREIGWRLARAHWGQGFASEAARRTLAFAFDTLGWPEVVSFTAVPNVRSQAVMERIGLRRVPDGDFEHPLVPVGHRLRPHVLYRLRAEEWATTSPQRPREP